MGQAILYCFRCSTQLREIQFEQGKAYKIDAWVCCAACAPEALKALPPDRAQALRKVIAGPEKKAPAAPQRDSNSRVSIAAAAAPPAAPGSPKWILIAGALLLGIGVLAAVALSGKPAVEPSVRAPAPEPAPLPPRPPPPPGAPADSPERQALRKAQQYAREHPDDLEGQLREFGDLTLLADKTDAGAEARKTMDSLQTRQRQIVEKGVAALDAELAAPLGRGDFAIALKTLEGARSRIAGALWKGAVEKRDREIRDRAIAAFEDLKAKAKGNRPELEALAARVRTWGLDALSAQLDALLAATTVPAPPAPELSAEAKAWQTRKEPAWARAAARDFAGAAADLERAAAALTEEALRKECADDVRDLKEFDRLYPAAISAAGSSKSLALRTVDDQSVSGRVLTADADRVELLVDPVKPTVFLEWSDVRASSLLPFLKELNPDARILQLLERLDGLARPKPAEDELRAREIYYEAERQFRTMATREKSLEGYRLLKQKHKDSALVRRAAARIDRRLDSGKDYYFVGADLAWGGSFSLTKEGRLESIAESDPAQANRNFVEAEYFPLPGAAYRCWVLAGGCCAEAFSFHYQASGLTELNPKTKKRAPAEPGSDLASPVKHSIRNLKPSHPKNEAKKPLRWEWVEVTLPRASGPGTRRIRFLTDQQGFGVAALLLSSTRSHPPAEAELGDLAKARALDATPAWALSRPGSVPRILLDDFEGGIAGWGYHGGNEFPGAKGSQAYDPAVGHEGKGSLRLAGDFTGGGAYVSTGRPLPPGRDVKEVRFWLKSDRAVMLGIRIGDSTDQCHQHPVQLASTKDWQEVVLTFEKLAGKEHWGGANDGKWHGPAKSFYLCVSTTTFAGSKAGEIWIDDVEAILNVESDR